jgi:hypothetical protein
MKKIILSLFLFANGFAYSQSISSVKTEYSQIEKETIGKESFTFSLYNSYINITDNDYNSKTNYGPLYLDDSGYKDSYYYLFFKPDIKSDPLGFSRGKELKAYRFLYKTKGGNVLRIDEMVIRNKQVSVKTFYTNEGYQNINSPSENYEIKADFDVRDLIINSKSLMDLMGRINFSFEQNGDKKTSDDGQSVTVRYDNESNVTPLVSYNKTGQAKQIILLVPKNDAEKVIKELLSIYGTKEINGEEVIVRDNLTYDYRVDGDIGIIVIK